MIETAPTPSVTGRRQSGAEPEHRTPPRGPSRAGRKPNKFMADLTRAMQVAAESARGGHARALQRRGEGAHREPSTPAPPTEATELRKRADDDIAGIREWSKKEIARIREETDERIAHRKEKLEREIEAHAAADRAGASSASRTASQPSRARCPHSSSGCSPRRIRPASPRWPRACPSRRPFDDETAWSASETELPVADVPDAPETVETPAVVDEWGMPAEAPAAEASPVEPAIETESPRHHLRRV